LPPVASQPEGVQLNFAALGLMLLGLAVGWKHDGAAALLIASGWTLWHISEGHFAWNLFQTPLPIAALYAGCWWATRGRKTGIVVAAVAILAATFGLGRLFVPANVFVNGTITDTVTGLAVADASVFLTEVPGEVPSDRGPNARSGADGRFILYLGWYAAEKRLAIVAPGYSTLTTILGTRALGQRKISRSFQLQPSNPPVIEFNKASLRDAIEMLANHLRLNVVFDPQLELDRSNPDGSPLLQSAITLRWDGVPMEDALAALLNNYGLRIIPDTRTGISRILKKEAGAGSVVLARPPPVVIQTIPESGAADVDPGLTEIRATFSKPMLDGSWSWTIWGEENFPELAGQPRYLDDGRTCVLPVRLKAGTLYATWLNSDYHQDFKDREGRPAVPYLLIFQTRR
jgi:hypothetical protein